VMTLCFIKENYNPFALRERNAGIGNRMIGRRKMP
jgi:hypothetical protein